MERVLGLQRALGSLQQASDRREHAERKLRAQLEKELQALRCVLRAAGAGRRIVLILIQYGGDRFGTGVPQGVHYALSTPAATRPNLAP